MMEVSNKAHVHTLTGTRRVRTRLIRRMNGDEGACRARLMPVAAGARLLALGHGHLDGRSRYAACLLRARFHRPARRGLVPPTRATARPFTRHENLSDAR